MIKKYSNGLLVRMLAISFTSLAIGVIGTRWLTVSSGMVMMLMGGNSRQVVEDVKHKITEIEKTLPAGVYIDTFYDRTELVDKTIATVAENIGRGVVPVIIMLFLLLGDVRAGLVVAAAIPLSAMSALIAMKVAGVSANLMGLMPASIR